MRPANRKIRQPHTCVSLGQRGCTEANLDPVGLQSVYDGRLCIGFLLSRGKLGIEAFNADDTSLGLFPDQASAVNAVADAAEVML